MIRPSSTRPTWAEVSRSALLSNYHILRERAARTDADAVAVIKANAYGHGAAEALATLVADDCRWFAVTCSPTSRRPDAGAEGQGLRGQSHRPRVRVQQNRLDVLRRRITVDRD